MSPELRRAIGRAGAAGVPLALVGCGGEQSAFAPAGIEAARIDLLFWIMTTGGAVIFVAVAAMTVAAIYGGPRLRAGLADRRLIVGGGIVFPLATLSVLLGYGLVVMAAGGAPDSGGGGEGRITIAVEGEQWWWRVTYTAAGGATVESANELHLPVGVPVTLELTTADVIHSFWAPRLAGKLDMIPGRTNRLTVVASEAGTSRGQCAEYCGGAHALMSFHVVAQEPDAFAAWLEREAGAAAEPSTDAARRGRALFLDAGCGACHTVRGTPARGTIGPDLTRVGGRMSIAAATLPNDADAFARWISDNQHVKPDNLMPPYAIFTDGELADLAAYLEGLR